jgi:GT2 family glycosyltransferase
MAIKKYVMMAVKVGVGLIPKPVRNYLKKNPALTSFYSRSLQQSGLFYGFPSKKKLQALYSHVVKTQSQEITTMLNSRKVVTLKFDVVIFVTGKGSLDDTLASLTPQLAFIHQLYIFAPNGAIPLPDDFGCHLESIVNLEAISRGPTELPLFMLNQGDCIHPQAFAVLARQTFKGLLYTDSDEMSRDGERENARLLPDWNPDYQLTTGYIETSLLVHPQVVSTTNLSGVGSIAAFVGQLCAPGLNLDIKHLPLSLIHYPDNKKRKNENLHELAKVIENLGGRAIVDEKMLVNRIQWPVAKEPLVSLIIPTKNGKQLVQDCIESILNKTTYTNYEIILVDNNSDEPESLEYFAELAQHPQISVIKYPYPFNYSAINNFAVSQCHGDIIGLVNNDIEVITPTWLELMVGHAQRPDIGCVGAKLLYSDGRVQHAGVVMGYGGGAGHAHKYFPRYHPGYMNRLSGTNNYSAVTAACLLIKRELFTAAGGLNETDLEVAFNDVDFCLKVQDLGVRNLYCAEAELFHHESVSRGLDVTKEKMARFERELHFLQTRWGNYIAHDPAYNPYLTLARENFSVKDKKEASFH